MIPQAVRYWVVCLFAVALSGCGTGIRLALDPVWTVSASMGAVGSILVLSSPSDLSEVENVTVGGTSALFLSRSKNELKTMVMPGSTTGDIKVEFADGSSGVAGSFQVVTSIPPSQQLGQKLVGSDASAGAQQGRSVALSADGKTALVGGDNETPGGAAWVFVRNGSTWTQQGTKLVGSGQDGAQQGYSVALSADGNTALVGGFADNESLGAAWVFVRKGSTWTQQGAKLVGTGNTGAARQGSSVSLSADGNTAILGGPDDSNYQGAAWVFVRKGSTWTQQGSKLVGTGNSSPAAQGFSVALSADGNTAILGGPAADSNQGAAWVFVRNGSTWTQQGSKLVGTGNSGAARQGSSVSLSANGNTAILGGPDDSTYQGAAWVFVRKGSTWTQQGSKLVGTGSSSPAAQGSSVALSADGNTAILGGPADDSDRGAAWVFVRNGATWTQQGSKLVGTDGDSAQQGFSVALSADGATALLGGPAFGDSIQPGAAWVFGSP
jgi:hypothetical protein